MFNGSSYVNIHGGTFTIHDQPVHHHYGQSTSFANPYDAQRNGIHRLLEASSPGAFHDSGARFDSPRCHPNTRVAVLEDIMEWFLKNESWDMFVMWLYGPAGAGKSAIAQSFAEQCSAVNGLLASFFFSRTDPKRNTDKALAATLAYQVASKIFEARAPIELAIENDPLIFQRSFETQFTALIVEPFLFLSESGLFQSTSFPYLMIIDGLDECRGAESQQTILHTIANAVQKHRDILPLRFLIASRPEHHITLPFGTPPLNDVTVRLALDSTYQSAADIKRYLIDSFEAIKSTHPLRAHIPPTWPAQDDVDMLVRKSSQQFIYAATVIRYVSSSRHRPVDRLKIICGAPFAGKERPYAELDALYASILAGVDDIDATLRLLGVFLLTDEYHETPEELEEFLFLDRGQVQLLLLDLASVVEFIDDETPIRFHHASFSDFLFDPTRSLNYHIDLKQEHIQLTLLCIRHIKRFWESGSVSQYGPLALDYAMENITEHLSQADLTDGLRAEVLDVPYIQSLSKWSSDSSDEDGSPDKLLSKFLYYLLQKESDQIHLLKLYIGHRKVWDQMLRDRLSQYPMDLGLAFCIVLVGSQWQITNPLNRLRLLPLMSESHKLEDILPCATYLYCLRQHQPSWQGTGPLSPSNELRELLLDFLEDKSRAGPYVLDEAKYTMVAKALIELIVRPWDETKRSIRDQKTWNEILQTFSYVLWRAGHTEELSTFLSDTNLIFRMPFAEDHDLETSHQIQLAIATIKDYMKRGGNGQAPRELRVSIRDKEEETLFEVHGRDLTEPELQEEF